jgi:hypothetical protein
MRLFQPSLQVRELPELKPILQRMWADGVAMGPLPARAGGPAARIPWQASLRHPDWVSPQVPLVDMVAAVFGFARDQSTLFNGNGFALRVGRPSTFGECDMATFRPIASSSGNTTTPKANDGDPTTRWISRPWTSANTNEWLVIDLMRDRSVVNVSVNFEAARPAAYDVQGSADSVTWSTLASETGVPESWASVTVTTSIGGATTRYVRILITTPNSIVQSNGWSYSVWEVDICTISPEHPPSPPPPPFPPTPPSPLEPPPA